MLGQHLRFSQRLRTGGGHDGDAFIGDLDGDIDETVALVEAERGGLGGGAVDEQAMRAVVDVK